MHAKHVFEVLNAYLTSLEITFHHKRHRDELSLFALLLRTVGNRPGALPALRYRDVHATLIQSPDDGGESHVSLEFEYTHTIGRLSQRNRYGRVLHCHCLGLISPPEILSLQPGFAMIHT